ncbi:pseudouridine synthase [Salinibacter sp. 10B]|uniref:RluA family pseudouridine synthase n=1 Tax=Salinibacter sp. 10B TaxID=1923971 RepID=UPI000CF3D4C1|nr:RluA family pseudouridine synthase [Salinibacter sp. 10B]PQJ34257.1 pseudouridine synthase [Salinibacter sp. 10B]
MSTSSDHFHPDDYKAEVTRKENVVEVNVPNSFSGQKRVDKYLTRFYPDASRTKIQRSIRKGHIAVNGEEVQKSYLIEPGDRILFRLIRKPPMEAEPEDLPLDVVYEDEDLLVVNKQPGMVVHPAPGHRSGTLVHAVLHHVDGGTVSADDSKEAGRDEDVGLSMVNALPESPDHPVVRPGIVHRLDKGTSGLLVVAKRDRAHTALADQFKAHTVDRHYRAILWGHLDPPNGRIEGAIGRDPHHRQRMAVVSEENGKWAVTHYQTIERLENTSVVDFWLETGRTHQIRVHSQYRNHPILGDPKYGGQSIRYGTQSTERRARFDQIFEILPHPALHAYRLGFTHPRTGKQLNFEVDPPSHWEEVLELIRSGVGEG